MSLDLSTAVEAAYRGWREGQRGGPLSPGEFEATYSRMEAAWMTNAVAAAAPLIAEQVRAQVSSAVEARQIICPIHHMPDCSPLLNGCSLPIHLHEQRAIDATLARGESA